MTSVQELEFIVTLRRGAELREVPIVALAAAAHTPIEQMRHACAYLLDALHHPLHDDAFEPRERGTTGGEGALHNVLHSEENIKIYAMHSDVEEGPGGSEGHDEPLTAEALALKLNSPQSVPFFAQLLQAHEKSNVDRALNRALKISVEKLRGTRAAYFVGCLRQISKQSHS